MRKAMMLLVALRRDDSGRKCFAWPIGNRYRGREIHLLILFLILTNGFALKRSNSSILLRKLLRGYEPLPPSDQGPVTVELGIYINYFYDISEQTMDYSVSMYLRRQWNDTRLRFNPVKNNNNRRLKVGHEDIRRLWIPDVFIPNEKSASFHYVTSENDLLYIYSGGTLWYVSKITATLSCPMRLQRYPMDTQQCPMIFESFGYSSDDVLLKWIDPEDKAVEFDDTGKTMPQFVIDRFHLNDCTYNGSKIDTPSSFPCLQVTFVVSRNLGYYMIQYYIPSVLLVILSWVGFWISVDAVVARVSIGLLTVLNLTMQSTGSRNQLPQVSYIKAIDVWMSVSLAFAFGSLLEFAIVNVWSRKEVKGKNNAPAPAASATSATSAASATSAVSAASATSASSASSAPLPSVVTQTSGRRKSTDRRMSIEELQQEQVAEVRPLGRRLSRVLSRRLSKQLIRRHVKTAQTIDRLSRKLFPLTFLGFNVVYWFFYILRNTD